MCYILFCSQVGLAVGDTKVIRDQIELQRLSLKVCIGPFMFYFVCVHIIIFISTILLCIRC